MIYDLKAVEVYMAKIESTTTKKVIASTNDGLKREDEEVQRSLNIIIRYIIRYTPKLNLILKLLMNR